MRVIITGKNSYIGKNLKSHLQCQKNIEIDELDLRNENWSSYNLKNYDSIIHLAAIVHRSKEENDWQTYYEINTLLPYKLACIAKKSGVKQFVYMSSMAVYGQEKKLPEGNIITSKTPLNPTTYYGKSKLEAELLLQKLNDDNFKVCIIRPPNVYGKDCPGNYFKTFITIAKYLKVFPNVFLESKQSLLHIDTLSRVIETILVKKSRGVVIPQDHEPLSTVELLNYISMGLNKKIYFSKIIGWIIKPFYNVKIIRKIFGGVSYDINLTEKEFKHTQIPYELLIDKSI